ncbi:hypothetical protein AB0E25_33455 [Streptomyces bobili]|uniref:hypothetical protein n=1 Tax=Streptomyces bobili TaxID=67280 RepID=UPI00341108F8
MTEQEASLIIRQNLALADEGIGPRRAVVDGEYVDQSEADSKVLDEAVRVAGHLFDEHYDLWDAGMVPNEVHLPRCDKH